MSLKYLASRGLPCVARGLKATNLLPRSKAPFANSFLRPVSTSCLQYASQANSDNDPMPEVEISKGSPSCDNCAELSMQLKNALKEQDDLEARISDLTDKYKRALAEMENVRHRLLRQADEARQFAVQSFAKDLLVVTDSLSSATKSVSAASSKVVDDGNFRALYDGLVLTDGQLHHVFSKHGLNKINPAIGDPFDPKFHEALFQKEADGNESDTIADVQKVGYSLHERCIRPAIVGVFK